MAPSRFSLSAYDHIFRQYQKAIIRKMIVLRLRLIFPTLARDGPVRRA
jgi:hypothetical protein